MAERLKASDLKSELCKIQRRFESYRILMSPIAAMVEQVTVNHEVDGSSPSWGERDV